VWYYVELKFRCHDTLGSIELRVDGSTVYTVTNVDTLLSTSIFNIVLGQSSSFLTTQFDDLYLCNTAGSVNMDDLCPIVVETLMPTGAGATTNLTPSAGNNWACVDDVPPNDDTDFIEGNTVGNKDLYVLPDLTTITSDVRAVQTFSMGRKTDSTNKGIRRVLRSGGTENDGSEKLLTLTSYVANRDIDELNPLTSAAWTVSEINALEAGLKIST